MSHFVNIWLGYRPASKCVRCGCVVHTVHAMMEHRCPPNAHIRLGPRPIHPIDAQVLGVRYGTPPVDEAGGTRRSEPPEAEGVAENVTDDARDDGPRV